jgi:hypothetical protein
VRNIRWRAQGPEDDIVRGSGNDAAVQRAARAAAARHEELAKGHIMLLLGPTLQSQLLHMSGGRELWDKLEEQFGLWEDCQGPVWQREWRQIGQLPLEGAPPTPGPRAWSRRQPPPVAVAQSGTRRLAGEVRSGNRPVPETSLVDDALDGLIRERPEWQGYLCGLKGALPSTRGGGLKGLWPHLGDLENRNVYLSTAWAHVLALAPMAHAAATETAAEARVSRLEEAL